VPVFERAPHSRIASRSSIATRERRHEGIRAGRDHELVIGERLAGRDRDGARGAIDRRRLRTQAEHEVLALEEARSDEREVFRRLAREELGEVHAIVSGAGLFAEHRDVEAFHGRFGEAFEELVAHHSVADDDDFHDRNP
jgi:hypothetical protein